MTLTVDPVDVRTSSTTSKRERFGLCLDPASRIKAATAAGTTRHADRATLVGLTRDARPRSGDLVLVKVFAVGQRAEFECLDGCIVHLRVDDELLVVYGDRYNPDQLDPIAPSHLGPCDLAADGGVAVRMLARREAASPPTSIMPLGLVTDANGDVVNLLDHRLVDSL